MRAQHYHWCNPCRLVLVEIIQLVFWCTKQGLLKRISLNLESLLCWCSLWYGHEDSFFFALSAAVCCGANFIILIQTERCLNDKKLKLMFAPRMSRQHTAERERRGRLAEKSRQPGPSSSRVVRVRVRYLQPVCEDRSMGCPINSAVCICATAPPAASRRA